MHKKDFIISKTSFMFHVEHKIKKIKIITKYKFYMYYKI